MVGKGNEGEKRVMASRLDAGSQGSVSNIGRGHPVVFLSKTLSLL